MHKQIEDAMQVVEFYYPILLLCILLKVNGNEPYRVIQMRKEDFMYYEKSVKMLRFNLIPYSKVAQLQFAKPNLQQVGFKLSHGDKEFQIVNIGKKVNTRNKQENVISIQLLQCKNKLLKSWKQRFDKDISAGNKTDPVSGIKCMPPVDCE